MKAIENIDFSQLSDIKTPESWIEKAKTIPGSKKPLPFLLKPAFIGAAASFVVVAAAVLTLLSFHSFDTPPLNSKPAPQIVFAAETTAASDPGYTAETTGHTSQASPEGTDSFSIRSSPYGSVAVESGSSTQAAGEMTEQRDVKPDLTSVPATDSTNTTVAKAQTETPGAEPTQSDAVPEINFETNSETNSETESQTVSETVTAVQPQTEPQTVPATQTSTVSATEPEDYESAETVAAAIEEVEFFDGTLTFACSSDSPFYQDKSVRVRFIADVGEEWFYQVVPEKNTDEKRYVLSASRGHWIAAGRDYTIRVSDSSGNQTTFNVYLGNGKNIVLVL